MVSKRVNSVSELFVKVLDGCKSRNNATIGAALKTLIRKSRTSRFFSEADLHLFRLCLLSLHRNKIEEISGIFDRLLTGWMTALMAIADRYQIKRDMDVEIQPAEGGMMNLRTSDSVIARRLQSIRGIRLDTIEHLATGETFWNLTIKRSWLPKAIQKLRRPHYFEFLNKQKSRQLSFEF